MRLITVAKILLILGCIALSLYFTLINYSIDRSINTQLTALTKLKNDPKLDSAVNRKIYAQRKADINQEYERLRAKRHSQWFSILGVVLAMFDGWLIRRIVPPLFKKRSA